MDSFLSKHATENSNNPTNFARLQFCGPAFRQNWSLPDTITFYITQNPSTSKLYQKMIQTCKYFFSKKPIIICDELIYDYEINEIWIKQNGISKDTRLINSPLWITNKLHIDSDNRIFREDTTSSIIPKIYRCDAKDLYLLHQHISFKEFVFLASNAEEITMYDTIVKNEDGSVAAVEKLVQHTSKVSRLDLSLDNGNNISISPKTVTNLLAIPQFSSLNLLTLEEIPESFDIENFYSYIKRNKHTHIRIFFSDNISEGYRDRLEAIENETFETNNNGSKIPSIRFPKK